MLYSIYCTGFDINSSCTRAKNTQWQMTGTFLAKLHSSYCHQTTLIMKKWGGIYRFISGELWWRYTCWYCMGMSLGNYGDSICGVLNDGGSIRTETIWLSNYLLYTFITRKSTCTNSVYIPHLHAYHVDAIECIFKSRLEKIKTILLEVRNMFWLKKLHPATLTKIDNSCDS